MSVDRVLLAFYLCHKNFMYMAMPLRSTRDVQVSAYVATFHVRFLNILKEKDSEISRNDAVIYLFF